MIRIRDANIDDLPRIRNLASEIWPVAYGKILSTSQLAYMLEMMYSISSLTDQMQRLGHTFLLMTDDELPVGFASFSRHENENVFHLNKIYVLPGYQGKNLGKQLLNHVIESIKKEDASALQLNVNRHNKALHFYEKQGFKIIGKEDIDIGGGYFMNDYVMELKL